MNIDEIIKQKETEIIVANARIAELEAKLEAKEMDYSALQESYINSEMNLEHLQSHDKEAMELLDEAGNNMTGICYLCKNQEQYNRLMVTCHYMEKRGIVATNRQPKCKHFKWQHADRYEALKAQSDK